MDILDKGMLSIVSIIFRLILLGFLRTMDILDKLSIMSNLSIIGTTGFVSTTGIVSVVSVAPAVVFVVREKVTSSPTFSPYFQA
jgi:voltage-gated potassium channel Kch